MTDNNKRKKKNRVPAVVAAVCGISILACGWLIVRHVTGNDIANPLQIRDPEVISQATADEEMLAAYAPGADGPKLKAAKTEVNGNIVGWVRLNDISQPVLECENNDYYRTHTVKDKNSQAGAISLDFHCSRRFTDWNNILYGQNLAEGKLFGKLADYKSAEVFRDASRTCGTLWTMDDATYAVTVFAYLKVADKSDAVFTTAIATDAQKKAFLSHLKKKAAQYRDPDMTTSDSILTLSTASADGSRHVVVAKLAKQK